MSDGVNYISRLRQHHQARVRPLERPRRPPPPSPPSPTPTASAAFSWPTSPGRTSRARVTHCARDVLEVTKAPTPPQCAAARPHSPLPSSSQRRAPDRAPAASRPNATHTRGHKGSKHRSTPHPHQHPRAPSLPAGVTFCFSWVPPSARTTSRDHAPRTRKRDKVTEARHRAMDTVNTDMAKRRYLAVLQRELEPSVYEEVDVQDDRARAGHGDGDSNGGWTGIDEWRTTQRVQPILASTESRIDAGQHRPGTHPLTATDDDRREAVLQALHAADLTGVRAVMRRRARARARAQHAQHAQHAQ